MQVHLVRGRLGSRIGRFIWYVECYDPLLAGSFSTWNIRIPYWQVHLVPENLGASLRQVYLRQRPVIG